jgi:hypothetical protein
MRRNILLKSDLNPWVCFGYNGRSASATRTSILMLSLPEIRSLYQLLVGDKMSSRERATKKTKDASKLKTARLMASRRKRAQVSKSVRSDEDRRLESDFLAVTAIFAGGAGFTIQFIGLRGLPWPCAVAQLGAIIAMAIIRALVRRGLGDDPDYCSAPFRYELDLLATQLVNSSSPRPPNQPLKPSQKDWACRVDTAKHRLQSIYSFRIESCLNPSIPSLSEEDSASSQSGQ